LGSAGSLPRFWFYTRVLVLYLGSGSDPNDDFLEELMDEFKLELLVVILLI